MSTISQSNQTRNTLFNSYDFSKLLLFDNKFATVAIAASGSDLTITEGTLIGAVSGTHQVYKSGTSNITLRGVAAETITIADGDTANVKICIGGRVSASKLVFDGTDALTTVVSGRTIRERLEADTLGIEAVASDELTKADNT